MRFRITLNRTSKQRMLPMDYQYYISAWIYKVLRQADNDFAQFLHDEGYGKSADKLYKLFCFSRLDFGKPKLWKEKKLFEISAKDIYMNVSFNIPEAATNFIKGLFRSQQVYLGDKFNGIDFIVQHIASIPEPTFKETMHYRLVTPWVVSYKEQDQRNAQYLKPDHHLFNNLSVKHLTEKYNNTHDIVISGDNICFSPEAPYKRSGFLIKNGSRQETRVVGNLFDFELLAPIEIHQMIWSAGCSEKSSSGFGWMELVE